jgi:hypothetical protein
MLVSHPKTSPQKEICLTRAMLSTFLFGQACLLLLLYPPPSSLHTSKIYKTGPTYFFLPEAKK